VNKPKLLLLDADVIVFAHELGVWEKIKNAYDVHVPATVIEIEVRFFTSKDGAKRIDLQAQMSAGEIKRLEATGREVAETFSNFESSFLAALHDGEKEAIAILISQANPGLVFCTGDVIAIQSVAMLGLAGQCISFEELLEKAGLLRGIGRLMPSLSKKTHETHSEKGKNRRLTGECFKKPLF
jgi:hypothetical protein